MRLRHPRRITTAHWSDDPAEYWHRLGEVDISLSCSREESFGVSMLEHAAAGAACVVPERCAYPEIHPGARLVPEASVAALASAILELARDPVQRRAVATACRQHAAAFTPRRTAEGLLAAVSRWPAG